MNLLNALVTADSGVTNTMLAQNGGLLPSHSAQLIPAFEHLSLKSSLNDVNGTTTMLTVTDREAPASGLAADVPTGHAAHSRDSDQDHRT
jgi:hypothetical protein